VDEHSLKVLELPRVLDLLASHTTNSMGYEAALAVTPSPHAEVVARRLQETREARHLRDHDSGLPLGGIRDIRDSLRRAEVEQQLTPIELCDIGQTIAAARRLRAYLIHRAEACPLLAEIAANMQAPTGLDARISECISENGEVRDTASPELGRVRADRKATHSRLLDRLNNVLASERYRSLIQEPIVTEREGRYCVPVKAEHRTQFGGIVHDVSTSGATAFIEPGPCIELGNRLKELAVREEQEISRILSRLTGLVSRQSEDLHSMLEIVANLDLAHARAILAEEMRATEPAEARRGVVRLLSARHPLLQGAGPTEQGPSQGDVVPIDLEIGDRFDVLLLTGPNTGGKTVALKTVGLLALMRQCGMQIPAAPDSSLALFEQVFADIGDEQDIQQSLSTFSAHLRNIVRIVGSAGEGSLVLLDEVGAGTDPSEGAALAKAILSALKELGARVIATTHYGELKEFAYTTDRVENAAVEFDRESLRPTYRVLVGVPGSSHALYIARRLGLPAEIVADAEARMGSRDRSVGEMMEQIERSRTRAHEMEREAAAERRAAESARLDFERKAREVADIRRAIRREAEQEARAVVRRLTEKAENILEELRKANRATRKGPAVRRKLVDLRKEVAEALGGTEPDPCDVAPTPEGHVFRKGDHVRVTSLGADGRIIDDPTASSAQVQVGSMRATLPLDVLRPIEGAAPSAPHKDRLSAAAISMRKAMHIGPEVMIRAMRVDEAQQLLDRYMDDAYAAGIREARIVHGKGTGVLRKFVQEYLRAHPLVREQRPADESEGGAGATVAVLKE